MPEKIRTFKKPLANAFLALGVVMLGTFTLVRFSNSSDSTAGLEAFDKARAEVISAEQAGSDPSAVRSSKPLRQSSAAATGAETGLSDQSAPEEIGLQAEPESVSLDVVTEPDFSDWSEKRIAEYRESREAASDLPLAVLSIDTLNIKVPVYNGASDLNLNRGVARIKGTARVGEQSNLGIAGHRDGFFRGLQDIAVGDRIALDTLAGPTHYRVTGIQIVYPDDVHVLKPTESSTLTLVTCYPFYFVGSAPKRYIVTAEAESIQVQS